MNCLSFVYESYLPISSEYSIDEFNSAIESFPKRNNSTPPFLQK